MWPHQSNWPKSSPCWPPWSSAGPCPPCCPGGTSPRSSPRAPSHRTQGSHRLPAHTQNTQGSQRRRTDGFQPSPGYVSRLLPLRAHHDGPLLDHCVVVRRLEPRHTLPHGLRARRAATLHTSNEQPVRSGIHELYARELAFPPSASGSQEGLYLRSAKCPTKQLSNYTGSAPALRTDRQLQTDPSGKPRFRV